MNKIAQETCIPRRYIDDNIQLKTWYEVNQNQLISRYIIDDIFAQFIKRITTNINIAEKNDKINTYYTYIRIAKNTVNVYVNITSKRILQ